MANFFLTLGASILLLVIVLLTLGFFTVISWNTVLIIGFSSFWVAGFIFVAGLFADMMKAE